MMKISFSVFMMVGAYLRHLFVMVTAIVLMLQMKDMISVSRVPDLASDSRITV